MGWHTLRLRTRILLGYGLILILTSLLTLFLNSRANALNEQIKELNDTVARETTLGVQLDGQVASTQQAIDHYLLQPVPQNLRTAYDSLLLLSDTLSTAQTITTNAAQRQRLTALSAQLGAYQRGFQDLTPCCSTRRRSSTERATRVWWMPPPHWIRSLRAPSIHRTRAGSSGKGWRGSGSACAWPVF
jgi:hypothetical protein